KGKKSVRMNKRFSIRRHAAFKMARGQMRCLRRIMTFFRMESKDDIVDRSYVLPKILKECGKTVGTLSKSRRT
ncbi:hypothetical protein M431DRAFT_86970, partial [Trichoderma harzianum CBS 226.95]